MSDICLEGRSGGAMRDKDRHTAGRTGWLHLAATPTFAIMALVTGLSAHPDMLCSAAMGASPLNGMALMYALMGAFHSAPWLRLIAKLRREPRASAPGRRR